MDYPEGHAAHHNSRFFIGSKVSVETEVTVDSEQTGRLGTRLPAYQPVLAEVAS